MLNLSVVSQTNTTVTLGWNAVPNCVGYKFTVDGKVSHTWDGTRTTIRVSKEATNVIVQALGVEDSGIWPALANNEKIVENGQLLNVIKYCLDGDILLLKGSHLVNNLNIYKSLTIKSFPGETALIIGRLVTRTNNIYLEDLKLNGKYTGQLENEPSWTIASSDCRIKNCIMTNENTSIGINQVNGGDRLIVENCLIHDIGKFSSSSSDFEQPMLHKDGRFSGNRDHGIYLSTKDAIIKNTEIKNCSDRGIQFRGSIGAIVENTFVHDCGMGFMYGDLNASNNKAINCKAINNTVINRSLIESYFPGQGNSYSGIAYNEDGRRAVNANGVEVVLN